MAYRDDDKTQVADASAVRRMIAEAEKVAPALVLLSGPPESVGKQWRLVGPDHVLGRAPSCQIYLDDPKLSKNHARLTVDGPDVAILDLNSTNGTEVGGDRLEPNQPRMLANNDQVAVGNLVFKFLEQGSLEAVSMQQAFERSQMDALTRIYNKGAYLTKADELFKRARLSQTALSILVFDLDFFKKVNDTYGHQAGDYVLQTLAELVSMECVGGSGFFARYGGEEFVVLMPGASLVAAADMGEIIRAAVEDYAFTFDGQRLAVTVSMGVATLTDDIATAQALFEKADHASYESKRGGRNRVTVR